MAKLVLAQQGQSLWHKQNKFTGWIDIDLSADGREEALNLGEKLQGEHFDAAFTSDLKRAQHTLEIILREIGADNIPTYHDKSLNDRMYGDLQGMNREVAREKFGRQNVQQWRNNWEAIPPNAESLKGLAARVLPYLEAEILPMLKEGKSVLVTAHRHSLRVIIMQLENLTANQFCDIEVETAHPRVYELDENLIIENSYIIE